MSAVAHSPTAEQQQIVRFALEREENLLLIARAGAAKTTTLILIAEALSSKSILALAFNKKIALELGERMPSNVKAQTMNSLGAQAWQRFIGSWPKVNDKKNMDLFKELCEKVSPSERTELWEDYTDILAGVSTAKHQGFMHKPYHASAKPLTMDVESFFSNFEINYTGLQKWAICEILERSFKLATQGQIDFDDQLYCSVLMPTRFDHYDVVMADEAQDLSPINHAMIAKLVKGKEPSRIIAVGDPFQAIYGFRGADTNSMPNMSERFAMQELQLTLCFRSAQSIVRNARWRAPDMAHTDWAQEGIVESLSSWSPSILQHGDAIICRNNAPLFRVALALLEAGRKPEIVGSKALSGLVSICKKLGKPTMTQEEALLALEKWKEGAGKKIKSEKKIEDMAQCIWLFLSRRSTLGAATQLLQEVLEQAGSILLMTGHKSKGLEFDRVFFLDRFLCSKEDQDKNLRYVIETRAKRELYYVRSDAFQTGDAK